MHGSAISTPTLCAHLIARTVAIMTGYRSTSTAPHSFLHPGSLLSSGRHCPRTRYPDPPLCHLCFTRQCPRPLRHLLNRATRGSSSAIPQSAPPRLRHVAKVRAFVSPFATFTTQLSLLPLVITQRRQASSPYTHTRLNPRASHKNGPLLKLCSHMQRLP